MAKRGLSAEQIVSKLRQIEVLLAQGKTATLASSGWSILSGELAVNQATMLEGFLFDAVSFLQNGLAPAEVDVRWG